MIAQTASKIRGQMAAFSGKVSEGLCKAAGRLVGEVIYGVQARQSVHLTEIGRSLEETIPLGKTVNRLSRNLQRPELRGVVQGNLVGLGARRIGADTLLVLDLSDVVKPYGRKMECLARVRDGSAKELANGYWWCQVIGVENEGEEITPLYGELYSSVAKDFISENEELFKAIDLVSEACERRGVWVLDRGGDRGKVYRRLVPRERGLRFIIRQKGDRYLLWGTRQRLEREIAADCPLPYSTVVIREEKGRERVHRLEYGYRGVRLPAHPEVPLWLVVVKGLGREPLMLLTNLPMRRNRGVLWWVVSAYFTRWRIEETIRFGKQSYRVEDVRVLTYEGLRNLLALVSAAMFFAAVILGVGLKLRVLSAHVLKAAKRLFGIPIFRYYALADGIRAILTRFPRHSSPKPRGDPLDAQLSLFLS